MTSLTPGRTARPAPAGATTFDHPTTFRKDSTMDQTMHQADFRLADIREQHERHRVIGHARRHGATPGRSLRLRLGESLMRLGRKVGGDALTTPAWQG